MSEITITKNEYELLVRDSERLRIIERLLLSERYVDEILLKSLLGLPEKPVKSCEVKE